MRALVVPFAFLLTGCGPGVHIDPELRAYYLDFKGLVGEVEQIAGDEVEKDDEDNYTIEFTKSFGDEFEVIGECTSNWQEWKVRLLRSFWDKATPLQRAALAYHEFSHCLLDLDHTRKPNHYMNEYMPDVDAMGAEAFKCQVKQYIYDNQEDWPAQPVC